MEYVTIRHWDESVWKALEKVYIQSFPYGRKNKNIVRKVLDRGIAFLHIGLEDTEVIAMALTAKLEGLNALLIDYLGVQEERRGQGIGAGFVDYLKDWAVQDGYNAIVIEVETDEKSGSEDPVNARRIQFWEHCGFYITEYIHDYKIVPELYKAMICPLQPNANLPTQGEDIFIHIAKFHRAAWGGR